MSANTLTACRGCTSSFAQWPSEYCPSCQADRRLRLAAERAVQDMPGLTREWQSMGTIEVRMVPMSDGRLDLQARLLVEEP